MNIELALDARATLAEAPFWEPRSKTLYWVDIERGELHLFSPATGVDRSIALGQMVGTVVPRRQGGAVVALHHGFALLELETETLTPLADPNQGDDDLRFNDGKCDPAGRFWAGTISLARAEGTSALFRLDPPHAAADRTSSPEDARPTTDGANLHWPVHRMLDGLSNSNGLAWSLDSRTMYHIDSPTFQVTAMDFDVDSGTIDNRRVVIEVDPKLGKPDGMTIDAEGMLWIARFRGGCVQRWDPAEGKLLQQIDLPVSNVTACAFGGDELDELYVTTARAGLDEQQLAAQPAAGGIYRLRPGVGGVALPLFAG